MSTIIKSIESYFPEGNLTNEDLNHENPTWEMDKIFGKTGVQNRNIAGEHETAFDLSVKACEKLFEYQDVNSVDAIVYCTQSPDYIMPSNSFLLHKELSMHDNVLAFDFNHACTGYIYGLVMAHSFIKSGVCKCVLLVNSDTYSKYINKKDRSSRSLFGDAAAVSIIENSDSHRGIVDFELASSGEFYNKFYIPAGGHRLPKSAESSIEVKDDKGNTRSQNDIHMDGLAVWSFINSFVPKQINNILKKNNLDKSQIDLFIFHQASKMTLDSLVKKLRLDQDKVFINLTNIGNTVSASIPIALKDALDQGRIEDGSKVLLSGFGVGMSYGSVLIQF
jgi:3-oxoacyl-[acyl-carrier-protein] synthase III